MKNSKDATNQKKVHNTEKKQKIASEKKEKQKITAPKKEIREEKQQKNIKKVVIPKKEKNVQNEFEKIRNRGILISIIMIALIAVVIFSVYRTNQNQEEKKKEENNTPEVILPTEEELVSEFGMSKDDAANIVKKIYNNSDEYVFYVSTTPDRKYMVSVRSIPLDTTSKYIVVPETGQFYAQ